jgi:sulfite reductase beta subunit-like hemoprotein
MNKTKRKTKSGIFETIKSVRLTPEQEIIVDKMAQESLDSLNKSIQESMSKRAKRISS